MNLNAKKQLVEAVKAGYADSSALFMVNVQGLTVNNSQLLRSSVRKSGGKLKVFKARLVKRAFDELGLVDKVAGLQDVVSGQIAVIFVAKDPVEVAKALMTFAKKSDKKDFVVGGLYQEAFLNTVRIDSLSKLPPYLTLVQMCAGALSAPMASLARALQAVAEKAA